MIKDLRDWIDSAERIGELKRVVDAEVGEEIGGIVDWFQENVGTPALFFEKIPGYGPEYRILANSLFSCKRVAMTLELPVDLPPMEVVRYCKDTFSNLKLKPPVEVKKAPVMTNVWREGAVDLTKVPVPKWHEGDGGPYIGTGCLIIQQDPDTGWVNLGCYRVQRFDAKTMGMMITLGRHGGRILQKYWERKRSCPVAISIGQDPLLMMLAGVQIPYGVCEYDVAGGIKGQPIEVVRLPETGLLVPATAEMVIEGEMLPNDTSEEGPFGEWTGYYASGVRKQPVVRAQAVYFRDNPIMLATIPRKPPCDDTYYKTYVNSGAIWAELERAGIESVRGVWNFEAGGSRMFNVVCIEQMYPGHAKQVALSATSGHTGSYANRYTIVVDEDIDPTNINDVIWAMSTRVDPREDIEIIRRGWSSPLDPMSYPPEGSVFNARVLIDACRPWERRGSFPRVAQNSPDLRARIVKKWKNLRE